MHFALALRLIHSPGKSRGRRYISGRRNKIYGRSSHTRADKRAVSSVPERTGSSGGGSVFKCKRGKCGTQGTGGGEARGALKKAS